MRFVRTAVTTKPGNPDVMAIQDMPKPEAKPSWALIEVRVFGLNRSELFTRRGDSPRWSFREFRGLNELAWLLTIQAARIHQEARSLP